MKKIYFLSALIIVVFLCASCGGDDYEEVEYQPNKDVILGRFEPYSPAAVLLIDYPTGRDVEASGWADIEQEISVEQNSRFRIGSATKTYVATVVLQLVDEGVLSLDDSIADWLPDEVVNRVENAESATLRQTLNMTSGIYDYLGSDGFWDAAEDRPTHIWTADQVITYAYDEQSEFAPGDGWEYSNSNYILLHLIIEEATGQSLSANLRSRIFEPLEMPNSYLENEETLPGGHIQSYVDYGDGWENVTDFNDGTGMGDGGIVSDAADVATFIRALARGELLPQYLMDEMTDFVAEGDYGLGLSLTRTDWGDLWGHDGATTGFGSEMWYLPDGDVTIIILFGSEDMLSESEAMIKEALYFVLGNP